MGVTKFLGRTSAGLAVALLAIMAAVSPALAGTVTPLAPSHGSKASLVAKQATWGTLRSGDCQQTNGTITLNPDGSGTFSADTLTFQTHTHDVWHASFDFYTTGGTHLFHVGPLDSPGMSDGNPPPVYHWVRPFSFDADLYGAVNIFKTTQTYSC